MSKTSIIIIDDHTLLRETWTYILSSDPRFSVITSSGSAEEGIDLCKQHRPDIVMLDINLPGISGVEAVRLIRKFAPKTRIVGVSLHTQPAYMKRMMQDGASGYITKNSSREEMTEALLQIAQGEKYICKEIKDIIAHNSLEDKEEQKSANALSLREIEIIGHIKQGLSSKEIASAVGIAVKTVEVHRYNILRKLNLKNAAALVDYIHKNDLAG